MIDAVAELPKPPSAESTGLVALLTWPATVALTLSTNVQLAPPASVAPVKAMLDDPLAAVTAPPPHEPASALGVEISSPLGSRSVNAIALSDVLGFGLVIVNASETVPPTGIARCANVVPMTGAPTPTTSVAVAGAPLPPASELIELVVVTFVPAVVPVTLTETMHEAPAASDAPDRAMDDEPTMAPIVPPGHELLAAAGDATTTPAGSASMNEMPVSVALAFGLLMTNDNDVDPPSGTEEVPNDASSFGGATIVIDAVAEAPVWSLELTVLVVLTSVPAAIPTTFSENVQEEPPAIAAPDRAIELEPSMAVIVPPPHDPLRPLGVATRKPAGSVSTKAIWFNPTVVFGTDTVNDNDVVPPTGIEAIANDFDSDGAAAYAGAANTRNTPAPTTLPRNHNPRTTRSDRRHRTLRAHITIDRRTPWKPSCGATIAVARDPRDSLLAL